MRQHEGSDSTSPATRTTARTNRVSRASIHDGAKTRERSFTILTMVLAAAAATGTFLVGARAGAALNGRASDVSIAGMKMPRMPALPAATAAALPR